MKDIISDEGLEAMCSPLTVEDPPGPKHCADEGCSKAELHYGYCEPVTGEEP